MDTDEKKSAQQQEGSEAPVQESEVKTETNSQEQPADTQEEEEDKFVEFTKKAADSTGKILGSSYKKAKTAIKSANFEPRASVKLLDRLLDWGRKIFPAEKFDLWAGWFAKYGHAGLVTAEVLTIIFYLAAAIMLSNWIFILKGVGIAVLLVILQYTADKFLDAGESLIKSSPSRLGSPAFLDCLGLLMEVAGILVFLTFIVKATQAGWSLVFIGLGIWALCDAIAYIALNPSMANISISTDVRAGEEAIGIMSFFVKAIVRIVPIAFGVGTIFGAIGLLFATFSVMKSGELITGKTALKLIILCACLPFLSYVIFAFYHLVIDILRAILVLPSKLDETLKKG